MNRKRLAPLRTAVLLGLLGAAAGCGSDLLLGPDAAQGIEGVALLGPLCPVVSVDNPCPDRPYPARIRILDAGGSAVTRLEAGDDGRFRVGLEPGRYRVVGEGGDPFPRGGEQEVTVQKGVWASVTLHFDTGIR